MSGAKLDYRRYSEVLFDILFAGGQLGEKVYQQIEIFLHISVFKNNWSVM